VKIVKLILLRSPKDEWSVIVNGSIVHEFNKFENVIKWMLLNKKELTRR